MVVTVLVSGIPRNIPLHILSSKFDSIFDTDNIGQFTVRTLDDDHCSYGKWRIALDFQDGFEAMNVQHLLDRKKCTLLDNIDCILKARILHHTSNSSEVADSMALVSSSSSLMSYQMELEEHKKMTKQLEILQAQRKLLSERKKCIKEERKYLKMKKKLKKKLKKKERHTSESNSDEVSTKSPSSVSKMKIIELGTNSKSPEIHKSYSSSKRELAKCNEKYLSSRPRYKHDEYYDDERYSKSTRRQISPEARKRRSQYESPRSEYKSHSLKEYRSRDELRSWSQKKYRTNDYKARLPDEYGPCFSEVENRSHSPKGYYRSRSPTEHRRSRSPKDHYRRRSPDDHNWHRSSKESWHKHCKDREMDHRGRSPSNYYKSSRPRSPHGETMSPDSETRYRNMKRKIEMGKRERYASSNDDFDVGMVSSTSSKRGKTAKIELTDSIEEPDPKKNGKLKIAKEQVRLEFELLLRKKIFHLSLNPTGKQYLNKAIADEVETRFGNLSISWREKKTADELVMCYREQHCLADDEKLVDMLVNKCIEKGYQSKEDKPVEKVAEVNALPLKLKTDSIWNALNEVLEDVEIEEFEPDSTQIENEPTEASNETNAESDTSINTEDEADSSIRLASVERDNKVPDSPHFVTPITILLRQMKTLIKNAEADCKYLYRVVRKLLLDRLAEMMRGKEYTRSCIIIKMYREMYKRSDDEEFVKSVVRDIKVGKYELLTMELEMKNPENGTEEKDELKKI